MKNSIARKVTQRVSMLLLLSLLILFFTAFHVVYRSVSEKNRSYARAVVSMFSDSVAHFSELDSVPLNAAHAGYFHRYSDYVCQWYEVDYAYMYIIDEAAGTRQYLCISGSESAPAVSTQRDLNNYRLDQTLSEQELAVWHGEQVFAYITTNNQYGHEMNTLLCVEDSFGNRVVAGVDTSYPRTYRQIVQSFALLGGTILAVMVGVYCAVYFILRRQITRPAQMLCRTMQEYISNGERKKVRLSSDGTDEFAQIAAAFNSMSDDLDAYLEDIRVLTTTQENQKAEISIAARIQKGFLQSEFCDTDRYQIRALMTPAKDVGGDLYDYFPLDSHRVLITIADVSGKGVSAAMYMAVTLLLLRQYARAKLPPAQILRAVNDVLSERNTMLLFSTAFIGIYDSDTQQFTYANAGHNPPYIVGRSIRRLDGESGLLLGIFAGESYTQSTVQLSSGDTIFLYTDGVSEAVSPARSFFGENRIEQEFLRFQAEHGEDLVAHMNAAVRGFTGGAEQHDDVTMLALCVKKTQELLLQAQPEQLSVLREAILSLPLARPLCRSLCLAAEEWFVNLCSYAYAPDAEQKPVRFTLCLSDRVRMRFEDSGAAFDPRSCVADADEYDPELQIGGLGNLISFSIADEVNYEFRDGKNILTLTKYLEEESA